VAQPELHCCCQVPVLQHCCQQLAKQAVPTNSHNAVQALQLLTAEGANTLPGMALHVGNTQ
jgi:hypothetical protein